MKIKITKLNREIPTYSLSYSNITHILIGDGALNNFLNKRCGLDFNAQMKIWNKVNHDAFLETELKLVA
jgi:hypothetical protein